MADAELQSSPTSRKRSHDGELLFSTSPLLPMSKPDNEGSCTPRERSPSVAPSTASSSLTELTSISTLNPNPADPSAPQVKKRKLTFAEKEVERAVRRREKEEKAKVKEEERTRREDEKRVKDKEKRRKAEERDAIRRVKEVEKAEKEAARKVKDAERVEKQKAKDAEKEEKEAEKTKREAEKLKKERAQMRIGAFFGRPAAVSTPPTTPDDIDSTLSSRRSSIVSIDVENPALEAKSPCAPNPDYASWILPFFPHEHTVVAPFNRFISGRTVSVHDVSLPSFDITAQDSPLHLERISRRFPPSRRRVRQNIPVKEIMAILNGSEDAPTDLTGATSLNQDVPPLEQIPYKIISFCQDVRPPYQGTYSRPVSPRSSRKLSRNPTSRGLPDTNYDYDSEAEWQEPEPDDEDLGEEDELSEDEEDADEIDDFLDDADDISKRKLIATDVDPVCTGLFWEGESSHTVDGVDLDVYRMDVLHDSTDLPIDPYSSSHWAQSNRPSPVKVEKPLVPSATPAMQPPRLPLSTVVAPNVSPLRAFVTGIKMDEEVAQENKTPPSKPRGRPANPNKPVKMITGEVLPAFKAAIEGSDLNKVALIEILKKKFPKCSKDAIKDTLSTIAVRQGVKEVDKRWVLIA